MVLKYVSIEGDSIFLFVASASNILASAKIKTTIEMDVKYSLFKNTKSREISKTNVCKKDRNVKNIFIV